MNFSRFSEDRLKAARQYAAELPQKIADTCFDDDYGFASHVTLEEKQSYSDQHKDEAQSILKGEKDGNFTVAQRMYYYLTGESVPFLSS